MLSLRSCNDLITIIIDNEHIVLHWIKWGNRSAQNHLPQLTLKAQAMYKINHTEHNNGYIYNLSHLKHIITNFIDTNKLSHAYTCMALTPPTFVEQFVACPFANPTHQTFMKMMPSYALSDYLYLYPDDERNLFVFYLCSITQQQLLQYKLLAIRSNLNLKIIMPQKMALIQLYHAMCGPAFRHSQLAIAMQRAHNNIDQLFTQESIYRLLIIDPKVSFNISEQASYIRTSIGLALSTDWYKGKR